MSTSVPQTLRSTDRDDAGSQYVQVPDDASAGVVPGARRPVDLLTRDQMAQFSRRSDVIGLVYLIGHFALIGVTGWPALARDPHSGGPRPLCYCTALLSLIFSRQSTSVRTTRPSNRAPSTKRPFGCVASSTSLRPTGSATFTFHITDTR